MYIGVKTLLITCLSFLYLTSCQKPSPTNKDTHVYHASCPTGEYYLRDDNSNDYYYFSGKQQDGSFVEQYLPGKCQK